MAKVMPVDKEYVFEGSSIISQTDLEGIITFVNRKFCEVSGYTKEELLGQKHSIIRHPQMPKSIFDRLWNSISIGHTWNGLIKNIRKDGQYYWVDTEILPIEDDSNQVTGYIASRKAASRKSIQDIETSYIQMHKDEE